MPNVFCQSCRLMLAQGTLSATAWLVHSNSDGTILQVCPPCAAALGEEERQTFADRGVLNGAGSLDGEGSGEGERARQEDRDPADRSVRY